MFTTSGIYNEDNIYCQKWIVVHAVRLSQKELPVVHSVVRLYETFGYDLYNVCAIKDNANLKETYCLLHATSFLKYL